MSEPTTRPRPRRLRAWKVGLLGLLGLGLAVGAVLFWKATTLVGLPSIGPPFDLARYRTIELPDDDNAFTFYRLAKDRYREERGSEMLGTYSDWSAVTPSQLEHLANNREAMAIWFEGTKRDRGVYVQRYRMNIEVVLPVTQSLRDFSRLANLEAFRLEHEGDLAGAWAWLRANLRASRHSGQDGFIIERLVGIAIHASTSAQAIRWAQDPRLDAPTLRRAIDDILALEALTPPMSDAVRSEYFSTMNTLDDPEMRDRVVRASVTSNAADRPPGWNDRLMSRLVALWREPERSRRVIGLGTANVLTACDLPAAERARRVIPGLKLTLFDTEADGTGTIDPRQLDRWYGTTYHAKIMLSSWSNVFVADWRDESRRASLIVRFAEEIYKRENGRPPESADALVGPILKGLPIGYARPVDPATFVGPPLP